VESLLKNLSHGGIACDHDGGRRIPKQENSVLINSSRPTLKKRPPHGSLLRPGPLALIDASTVVRFKELLRGYEIGSVKGKVILNCG
jgi:hypothetical protein